MQPWPTPPVPQLPGTGVVPQVWDTLSGALRPSATRDEAGLYVCGITPYDATHLGHARTYLTFDTLLRAWRDSGLSTTYVQNVTDVDDPLLERAAATGEDWRELAAGQVRLFDSDMVALRLLAPNAYVSVTDTVDRVVAAAVQLLASGAAYRIGVPDAAGHGALDVYAEVRHDPRFGTHSHLTPAQMVEEFAAKGGDPQRAGKRGPLDALVWREQRPGEPVWDGGELGPGRPGWHIECAVIAADHLSLPFDVLGGGSDLAFPHHEWSRSHLRELTGVAEPARVEVHAAMVGWQGEKMSKSRGNLVFVSGLLGQGADPAALRLALLAMPYHHDWQWRPQLLADAAQRVGRWRAAAAASDQVAAQHLLADMRQALSDNLNTPRAIAAADAWAAHTLAAPARTPDASPLAAQAIDALLGIDLGPVTVGTAPTDPA